jgi:hypothetical protein
MKKIILVLLLTVFACSYDGYNSLYYKNMKVKSMHDYSFENDIKVSNIDEAIKYVWLSLKIERDVYVWGIKEYWQTPEETYKLKTGDCEDFCILLLYILQSKLNIEVSYFVAVKDLVWKAGHALVYLDGIYLTSEGNFSYVDENTSKKGIYIDPQGYFIYTAEELPKNGYQIKHIIPYSETIWMTVNYHRAVGKYF